jgi:2-polyprenyl-6-methoxyphenol hydroxylase-like FAD-dependent oxidoreductase
MRAASDGLAGSYPVWTHQPVQPHETSLVASGTMACGLPRDSSALIASQEGWVLVVPLPGGNWLTFVGDLDEDEARRLTSDPATGAVAAMIERRVAQGIRVEEVAWAAPFRMHRRLVPQLADRRCFLLGDAGHLSSPRRARLAPRLLPHPG